MNFFDTVGVAGVRGIGRAFPFSIALLFAIVAIIAYASYKAGQTDRLQQAW